MGKENAPVVPQGRRVNFISYQLFIWLYIIWRLVVLSES